jgi:hypothetical protein
MKPTVDRIISIAGIKVRLYKRGNQYIIPAIGINVSAATWQNELSEFITKLSSTKTDKQFWLKLGSASDNNYKILLPAEQQGAEAMQELRRYRFNLITAIRDSTSPTFHEIPFEKGHFA